MAIDQAWRAYKQRGNTTSKEELVRRYLPLVKYLVGRLAVRLPPWVSLEDIEGAGILGLLAAMERYDPSQGVEFESYARYRIWGAMLDEVRRWARFSRRTWQQMQAVLKVQERWEREKGCRPKVEDVAQELGWEPAQVDRLGRYFAAFNSFSLEEVRSAEGRSPWEEFLADPKGQDPLEELLEKEDLGRLAEAIGRLEERLQLILALYYQEGLTLREIGEVLGISESRVCQLHSRALTKLREILAEERGKEKS
ncbi:RNA polymerase, sigma 28 subunit, FliA/WhiG [Ammonifex degensii KC4]|uniref:RNA polymerase, sigma 28 subunit, FliA/WhiG n=1 Tax=Ammonifex degensii (strain DSM 10501 / KC4) TaxID=429009 RepID=C9R9X4_AMMDK|nr:FliA/WhiG family RNA polymerase sigma factor [Ammonifex degensii]ACX53103.1 RNA polymerase, sigma 28 subunit, FliA/WhiG [Ammonifex degensii KC4]